MLCKNQLNPFGLMHFLRSVFHYCFFCLDGLFTDVNMVSIFPTVIVLLSISTFMFTNICPTYFDALVLGAYIFTVVISSSHIDLFVII